MLEEAISDQKAIVHQLRTRLSDVEWKKKILDREHTELQEKLKATEERLASKMTECNQLESTVQMMRGNERAKRKLEENAEALNDLIETQRARIRELERMNTGSSHSPSSISSKKKSSKKRR